MVVYAPESNVPALHKHFDQFVEFALRDSELVGIQTGSDVSESVGVYVRIHPYAYVRREAVFAGDFIYYI